MKKVLWIFLGAFFFMGMPFWVSAQEEVNAKEQTAQISEGEVNPEDAVNLNDMQIVARVELYDAEIVSQENNKFKLRFRLVNEGDIQPQVKYLVQLTDQDNQKVIHQQYYDEMVTLGKGEELKKEIAYEAPYGLNGKYNIHISAGNLKGLTLALGGFGEVEMTGEGLIEFNSCYIEIGDEKFPVNSGVDIDPTEQAVVRCEVFNSSVYDIEAKLNVDINERSPFGEAVKKEEMETQFFKAKETTSVTYNLFLPEKPQSYDGNMVFKSNNLVSSQTVPLHYVVRGDSATIQNISLDKDDYLANDIMKIRLLIAGDADDFPQARETVRENGNNKLFAEVAIFDERNKKCADAKEFEIDKSINDFDLKAQSDCRNPNISVKLKNADGKILDENDFSLRTVSEEPTANVVQKVMNNNIFKWFMIMATVLVIATIATVIVKNKSAKLFIFFLLGGVLMLLGDTREASAATYTGSFALDSYTITYSLSASTINQGGSVTARSRIVWNTCLNATLYTTNSFKLDGGARTSFTNVINQESGNHSWALLTFPEELKTYTVSTPGAHNIYFQILGRLYYNADQDYAYHSDGTYACLHCDEISSDFVNFSPLSNPTATSCPCFERLITWNGSLPLTVLTAVNGSCNTLRAKAYTAAETAWAGASWCTVGTANNIPATFLNYGASTSWTCAGSGGGNTATCSASRAHLIATCGTRATTYAQTVTTWPAGTFCSGTPSPLTPAFPAVGTSTTWSCLGSNTTSTTDDKSCTATRNVAVPIPDVTLTTPAVITLDIDSDGNLSRSILLTTTISNVSAACVGTGCVCDLDWEALNKTVLATDPISFNNTINVTSSGSKSYSVTCTNSAGSDNATATVTAKCNPQNWQDTCQKVCGLEMVDTHSIDASCIKSTVTDGATCVHPPCPVTGGVREVN